MLKKLEKKRRVLELGFALGFALTVYLQLSPPTAAR